MSQPFLPYGKQTITEEDKQGLLIEKQQLESDVNMFGGLANPAFANIQTAE